MTSTAGRLWTFWSLTSLWAGRPSIRSLKTPDGAFTAIKIFSFSNIVSNDLSDDAAPRDALDYLKTELKGKLVLTYPHDDDAVLFQFDRLVSVYGWEYMDKLRAQDVEWIRGTVQPPAWCRPGVKRPPLPPPVH